MGGVIVIANSTPQNVYETLLEWLPHQYNKTLFQAPIDTQLRPVPADTVWTPDRLTFAFNKLRDSDNSVIKMPCPDDYGHCIEECHKRFGKKGPRGVGVSPDPFNSLAKTKDEGALGPCLKAVERLRTGSSQYASGGGMRAHGSGGGYYSISSLSNYLFGDSIGSLDFENYGNPSGRPLGTPEPKGILGHILPFGGNFVEDKVDVLVIGDTDT